MRILAPNRSLQGGGNLAAICIINRPDPGEHLEKIKAFFNIGIHTGIFGWRRRSLDAGTSGFQI